MAKTDIFFFLTFFAIKSTQRWDHVAYWTLMLAQSSFHIRAGFHDAVRTPYALSPRRHVGFFWNNKICFNFVSILFMKIKLTVSERTYIIVPMV